MKIWEGMGCALWRQARCGDEVRDQDTIVKSS
jgi:hypothetical protein